MAKRGSSPALYELIRARGPERAPRREEPVHRFADPGEDEGPFPGSWLRPGRILHVPVGYIFVAIAIAIGLSMLTYMVGYSRAKAESRHLEAAEADQLLAGTSSRVPGTGSSAVGTHAIPRDPLENRSSAATAPPPERRADPRGWGPIDSDPRQTGLYYLILMTTDRAGAERFVNFSRERGLETYMITSDNRRFRVIALPGFADHHSDAAATFREEVLRLGRMWMDQERTRVNPVGTSMWSLYGPRG